MSKISNIVSKSSLHMNRSSALPAILNELVHAQSHVTGLLNIGDGAIAQPFEVCRASQPVPSITCCYGQLHGFTSAL